MAKADLQAQARELGLDDSGTSAELRARIEESGNEPTSGSNDSGERHLTDSTKNPAVDTGENQPQGRTMPNADSGEVQLRDDVPLAKDIRTIPDAGGEVGEDQVQEQVDQENERGFRGAAADPTPNENYSVAGVTSGAPTPETSMAQRKAARENHTLDEGVEPY